MDSIFSPQSTEKSHNDQLPQGCYNIDLLNVQTSLRKLDVQNNSIRRTLQLRFFSRAKWLHCTLFVENIIIYLIRKLFELISSAVVNWVRNGWTEMSKERGWNPENKPLKNSPHCWNCSLEWLEVSGNWGFYWSFHFRQNERCTSILIGKIIQWGNTELLDVVKIKIICWWFQLWKQWTFIDYT